MALRGSAIDFLSQRVIYSSEIKNALQGRTDDFRGIPVTRKKTAVSVHSLRANFIGSVRYQSVKEKSA